jgi:hypothetical protein
MESMLIDYWTHFNGTPLCLGLKWAIGLTFLLYVVNVAINRRTVSGTYRAYRSATIIKTLLWPLFAGYLFCTALDLVTQDWFGALIDAWISFVLMRDWEKYEDSDDWWRGKGTKLKKRLRSMFTAPSPAAAGADA